ncbi:ATP-dependent DNA ligase [Bradyrhizobium ottawaense]
MELTMHAARCHPSVDPSSRMARKSTLPRRLQPMLATLTDSPFADPNWVFEDKFDGFRMVAEIRRGRVALYSRNGKIISHSYVEVAKALEGVKADAVIDGELVAIGKDGASHFQLLQNALRHEAKLLYCAFDLMFADGEDLRPLPLLERKKRLKGILPRHKLIAFSNHRKGNGTKFFAEAERRHLEGIMAKRADSPYASGRRTADWLKVKTEQRAGGGDRRLHGTEADPALLRRSRAGSAGKWRVAVHRPRRHRLQPPDSRRASRQAPETQDAQVALSRQGKG